MHTYLLTGCHAAFLTRRGCLFPGLPVKCKLIFFFSSKFTQLDQLHSFVSRWHSDKWSSHLLGLKVSGKKQRIVAASSRCLCKCIQWPRKKYTGKRFLCELLPLASERKSSDILSATHTHTREIFNKRAQEQSISICQWPEKKTDSAVVCCNKGH